MEVNEEKRKKFMEYAGKRVNNVLHDIQILEPMSRSTSYDFTKQDVEEMFFAMQESLNNARTEFEKKFEEKARSEKKVFTFGTTNTENTVATTTENCITPTNTPESEINTTETTLNTSGETTLENTENTSAEIL